MLSAPRCECLKSRGDPTAGEILCYQFVLEQWSQSPGGVMMQAAADVAADEVATEKLRALDCDWPSGRSGARYSAFGEIEVGRDNQERC